MERSEWLRASLGAFSFAGYVYGAAFVVYLFGLFSKLRGGLTVAGWISALAWAAHTLALVLRWADAGWEHPPAVGLYEGLAFFSWGLVTAHLFMRSRFTMRSPGVFVTATAAAALGAARLLPDKAVGFLPPVLLSGGLLVHVLSACLAYGFFAMASFLAVFYLIRDRVRSDTLMTGASLLFTGALGLLARSAGGVDVFLRHRLFLSTTGGEWIKVRGGFYFLAAAAGLFGIHLLAGLFVAARIPVRGHLAPAGWLGYENEGLDPARKVLRWVFALAAASGALLLTDIAYTAVNSSALLLMAHPLLLAAQALALMVAAIALGLMKWRPRLEERLPQKEKLDRWCYQAALIGFAFMTVALASGAVWAGFAWGRMWAWDPKEVGALGVWLVYAAYLHLRLVPSAAGRACAWLAIAGYVAVLLTLFGANHWVPGLHRFLVD